MSYWEEATGPGHRQITARNRDNYRTDGRGFNGGREMNTSERAYYRELRKSKAPTPTELVYLEILAKRKRT